MGGVKPKTGTAAYALLDVILAVAIFAIAVTGLVGFIQKIGDTSSAFAKDRLIQYGLEAALAEAKSKPVNEMTAEVFDEVLGVNYQTTVESLELDNGEGAALKDLYTLKVIASFVDDGGQQTETMEVFIHQPERR